MGSRNWTSEKWLALIVIVAIVLRVYAIDRLPPGLFGDEAVEGLDALDVRAGNFFIWFHAHLGREPLFVYLVALSYKFFGVTPLVTRLPALIAGSLTIPATFYFAREWARNALAAEEPRATRLALITTGLLAISFWHIEMSRNAHRGILMPLVETIGYFFLWRGLRTRNWKWFASAGAVLGLSIYTYSPGRFVGVFVAIFFAVEFLIARLRSAGTAPTTSQSAGMEARTASSNNLTWRGTLIAVFCAFVVMLPLGAYFARNPEQFVRRFDSTSILNAPQPLAALGESINGNLAQFVVPGAGYQSKHYNVPGKPVFDLFLGPWFLAGLVIALRRLKNSAYRFLLLWFVVMLTPPFLTADMIPKGVRGLGTMPGALMFIAVAMDAALNYKFQMTNDRWQFAIRGVVALTFVGSAIWTIYDYFVVWANLPELPLAFDSDYAEAGDFVARELASQTIFVSAQVYRHPTLMLLGKRVPTSQYFDRATRIKEFDATSALVVNDPNAIAVFVRDQSPPEDWYRRLAPRNEQIAARKFFAAYRLRDLAAPQSARNDAFSPLVTLVGYSRFDDDPRGVALYWRIAALPDDRTEMNARVTLLDARGQTIAQPEHRFGYAPLEWGLGETVIEWYEFDDAPIVPTQFVVELTRGNTHWKSQAIPLK